MKRIRFKEMDFSDRKQIKMLVIVIVFTCVVLIGTSYAWLSVSTGANKDIAIQAGTLNLEFSDTADTIINLEGAVPISDEEGLKSERAYHFTLKNIGDIDSSYTITLKDFETITKERLADKYVKYSLTKNGVSSEPAIISGLLDNGILKAGKTNTYELRIWLDEDNFESAATGKEFKKILNINASQKARICKRATSLHTEECQQTDTDQYCSGVGYIEGGSKNTKTITYGSLGTKGTLTVGDAFDCDVDGDGTYDSTTERFYYVTDLDSNTAVLIYSNNVTKGVGNNTYTTAYNSDGTGSHGPVTALLELPTINQWRNIELSKTKRNILNPNGTVVKSDFSYDNYVARLLTYQEFATACGNSQNVTLQKCEFLLENTIYSNNQWAEKYFFENTDGGNIYVINGTLKPDLLTGGQPNSLGGIRPVIEVAKSDILY